MKKIKATTKRGAELLNAYNKSNNYCLKQCYERPSVNKTRAEQWCIRTMICEDGKDFRIISYNTFNFTCGWRTNNGLRVETANNSYIVTDLPF